MSMRHLPRGEWRRYCDELSRALAGKRVELEVVSLDLGDHVEARWVPLLGIVYDARADVLEIAVDGIGHTIRAPREVHAEETDRGLVALEVIAADEARQIIKFREPLVLPPPRAEREESSS